MSCCGRGASWFGNCGSAGDTKRGHTWHEGIQACKARTQLKTVIGQQLNGAQQEKNGSMNGAGTANSQAVITAAKSFAHTTYLSRMRVSAGHHWFHEFLVCRVFCFSVSLLIPFMR